MTSPSVRLAELGEPLSVEDTRRPARVSTFWVESLTGPSPQIWNFKVSQIQKFRGGIG
jgi:hypothetical protein